MLEARSTQYQVSLFLRLSHDANQAMQRQNCPAMMNRCNICGHNCNFNQYKQQVMPQNVSRQLLNYKKVLEIRFKKRAIQRFA